MTKVNIREALNQMDKDTNCKYDLVTLYEGYNFNDEEKKEIAKMISDNKDAEVIYDRLSDKFGKDVDFDDDDISDITLDECDTTIDTEDYVDFETIDEDYRDELVNDLVKKAFTKEQAEYLVSHDKGMAEYLAYGDADNDDFEYYIKYINKRLNEDTVKTSKGKWVNKGEEGTHGTFDTKKEADAQRKAMFASGYKGESLKETEEDSLRDTLFTEYQSKYTPDTHDTIYNEIKDKYNDETLATQVVSSLENDYKSWFDESLKEEFKTYYISYKDSEGTFKDKYVDLPIRATSKEEAEEKFLKDHPNIKSCDYKVISQESLKEDWRDDKFTEDDFSTYVAKMKSDAYRLSNSIQYMINKHPEYADLFDNLVSEIVDIFSRTYLNESVSNESINEASYGGAYDIADDQYFTKEELVEFGEDVVDNLNSLAYSRAKLESIFIENNVIEITITWDGNEITVEQPIDMRRIRTPKDLGKYRVRVISKMKPKLEEVGFDFGPHLGEYELSESSYGGAYDILDDEYFTKDDGIEAANEVAYKLEKEFPEAKLEVMDMQLDNHSFYVALTDNDGNEFTEEITLDMRKIRHPLDLIKKYVPILAEKFIKQINDYYSEI